jgi:hypothetical protein
MCDQGHKVTFNSQKCKIRKEGSGKLIATAARTSSNIYVLSEIRNEKCFIGKEDESWLWHRRMGHIHFDNLFKVNKREEVREMPQITKPTNTLCKHCQQGKQTKTGFKSKEYSTKRPLEIVHIDLVVLDTPTTLRGGVNECGALFPKTSLLHKNSSISIQHLFITHCCHL